MKKVLLAVLCAGLFFACGNKKQAEQPETLIDTPVAQQPMVEPEQQVAEPVADEPVAQTTPAKKNNTTAKKNNNSTGMTAGKSNEAPSVEDHAKSAANRVANKAIDKAESEATSTIVNSGKKKR